MMGKIRWLMAIIRGKKLTARCNEHGKRIAVFGKIKLLFEKSTVEVGEYCKFYDSVKLSVIGNGEEKAHLKIGNNVAIGDRTEIHCGKEISIGSNTLISWDCVLMDRDYHKLGENGLCENKKRIEIGDNVWIGCRSLIMKAYK